MTKIFILVVHTKLDANLVYNGLKRLICTLPTLMEIFKMEGVIRQKLFCLEMHVYVKCKSYEEDC